MTEEFENLRLNVLRNALYHTARRLTFERWSRVFNFLIIALGAAGMGNFLARYGIDQMMVGAGVTIVGALQLTFDFAGFARTHQGLQRDYYGLLADLEEMTEPTSEKIAALRGKMMRISGEEPPILRALDAKAYNDAIDASGYYERSQRLHIPLMHRIFGRYWPYDGRGYDTLAELELRKPVKISN